MLPPLKLLPPFLDVVNKTVNPWIPQHVWIPLTDTKGVMQLGHLRKLQKDNAGWNFHFEGNREKLHFMETFFPNTSLLWAYKAINPLVGASAADLWRYSVLWLFGGLAMDDDSTFKYPLNNIVRNDDKLLFTYEKFDFSDNCYKPSYHLSGASVKSRSSPHRQLVKSNIDSEEDSLPFFGKNLAIWAIFAAPRHPALLRVLENSVEIIRKEYLKQSVLYIPKTEAKSLYVFCITGPSFFTASMRELVLDSQLPVHQQQVVMSSTTIWTAMSYRITTDRNFEEYRGVPKIPNKNDPKEKHYTHRLQHQHVTFLGSYAADYDAETLDGRIVRCADGSELGSCTALIFTAFGAALSNLRQQGVSVVADAHVVKAGRICLVPDNETLLAVSMVSGPPVDVPSMEYRKFLPGAATSSSSDPVLLLNHTSLQGQLLTASFKTFSLIMDGTRRGFHDWDAFSSMNFTMSSAKEVDPWCLFRLAVGPIITKK